MNNINAASLILFIVMGIIFLFGLMLMSFDDSQSAMKTCQQTHSYATCYHTIEGNY